MYLSVGGKSKVFIKDNIFDFSGDEDTYCELSSSAVQDFNIISNRESIEHEAVRCTSLSNVPLSQRFKKIDIRQSHFIAIYCHQGCISVSSQVCTQSISAGNACWIDNPPVSLELSVISSASVATDFFVATFSLRRRATSL